MDSLLKRPPNLQRLFFVKIECFAALLLVPFPFFPIIRDISKINYFFNEKT